MNSLPPVYCVTLREEPWKQEWTRKHFEQSGVPVKFVWGVQGVTVGLRPTNPYEFDPYGESKFLHPSTLGCLLSHRIAFSVALANEDPEFIICEDDVELTPSFRSKWEQFRQDLPSDADVVQLEYCSHEDKNVEPVFNSSVAKCTPYPFCAACIWWKRSAAERAMSLMRVMDRSYDIMLIERIYPFLNHYIAMPQLASQKSQKTMPSSIAQTPRDPSFA